MPEYIDRDKLYRHFENDVTKNEVTINGQKNLAYLCDHVLHEIRNAPTADVVEVVRCMHCIHFKTSVIKENYCDLHSSTWDKFYVRVDNFCSYGERKEVANNG